ncbi:MAG: succinate dehydrogenase, hydrophobic membrane anchor protein [Alphaproteobacteria bacterium]|nr:succinate dehydrogenase, hydrophobic membrane anchor protein [Alphaproteobacteria bacterium]
MRTALGRVRGLGSAKEGTHHWWMQRLTAIALIPLTLWFAISLIWLTGAEHADVVAWLGAPIPGALMLLLIGAGFYHLKLGVQVVVEDYVHAEALKVACLIVNSFGCIVLALASALAVLSVMLGG